MLTVCAGMGVEAMAAGPTRAKDFDFLGKTQRSTQNRQTFDMSAVKLLTVLFVYNSDLIVYRSKMVGLTAIKLEF
jgi:hypothetical protein